MVAVRETWVGRSRRRLRTQALAAMSAISGGGARWCRRRRWSRARAGRRLRPFELELDDRPRAGRGRAELCPLPDARPRDRLAGDALADRGPTGGADRRRDLAPPRHRHLDRARAARIAAGGDRRGRLLARRRDAGDALRGDGRGRALERARRRVRAQLRRTGRPPGVDTTSIGAGVFFRRRPAGDVAGDGDRSRQRGDDQLADRRAQTHAGGQSGEPPLQRGGRRHPADPFHRREHRLFVETDYQVGNSPTSTRLELRDPATGAADRPLQLLQPWPSRLCDLAGRAHGGPRHDVRGGRSGIRRRAGPLRRDQRDAAGVRSELRRDHHRFFARRGAALRRDRHHVSPSSTPRTCIPSVNLPRQRASPSWAFRPPTSWSVRCRGRPPGGTRPPARSSRPRSYPLTGGDLVGGWSLRRRRRRSERAVSLLARVRRRAALRAAGRPDQRAGAGVAGDAGTGRRESERDVERRLGDGHVGASSSTPTPPTTMRSASPPAPPARCCASSVPRSAPSRARSRTPRAIACSPRRAPTSRSGAARAADRIL